MTPLGHASITLLFGLSLSQVLPMKAPNELLLPMVIGGITPDLDLFYTMSKKGFNVLDKDAGDHRFYFTHTPFFILGLGLIITAINFNVGIYFSLGAIIHFLLDTLFFPEGINFGFPFTNKRVKLFTIKPGESFWAKKPIAKVPNWKENYLSTPLFWIFEVLTTLLALALTIPIVYK